MAGALHVDLLGQLVVPAGCLDASRDLAARVGAESCLVLTRDAELGVLLPAEGFPQTLRGGASWRAFLKTCAAEGLRAGSVDYPAPETTATALTGSDGTTLIFFGSAADHDRVAALAPALPLVGAALRAQSMARGAIGQVQAERAAAKRAHELARALDSARVELERALALLQEADRRKDEFLAMLGHELRNPMAAIRGAIRVMQTRAGDAADVERAQTIAERQAEQLARLIDDLLDVARITSGKISLRACPTDVALVCRRAVDTVSPLVDERGHRLSVVLDEPVWALADPLRLEQMVTNLLTNAAKYTPEGGHVTLTAQRAGDEARVVVEDNGVGIAQEMLTSIFDPFVQVAPTLDRAAGGLGVGLTLVDRLARLHGGHVEVTSEPQRGSRFLLALPASSPVTATAAEAAEPAVGPLRMLVVDDNLDSAEMMALLLAEWGHEVRVAHDGHEALRLAAETPPQVVLLDLGLPGLDGFQVAERLRASPATATARVIAVSGYGLDSDRAKTRAAGFDEHLVKPIDFGNLQRVLGSVSP